MELLQDPNTWVGLATLVVLEIVLGIDNLIFIAILAGKLPRAQRERARIIGLGLALIMRLGLLAILSWLFTLTRPWLVLGPVVLTGRDLILVVGGFFLVLKATLELHERIEGGPHLPGTVGGHASFWVIVTQIVVLDAVFSLDSVITAVGMVKDVEVMMAAVTIAIIVMLVASRGLTQFVTARPTVVTLCLGFLLMIGFALIADGFGYAVPKGYLYAAIAFAIGIEALNQIARRNLRLLEARRPLRERTAEGVLRMLGKTPVTPQTIEDAPAPGGDDEELPFGVEERNMVSSVLHLAERSIHSIMTPRADISWINLEADAGTSRATISATPHGFFPVCRGSLDDIVGVGRAKDMMADLLQFGKIRESSLRAPILVHETIRALDLIETLKKARGQLVMVLDEFGAVEGLVTPMDVFEAIAGDFPDEDETPDIIQDQAGRWVVDGATDLLHLEQALDIDDLGSDTEEFSTLAGYLLEHFGRLPQAGDTLEVAVGHRTLHFRVLEMEGRRITKVLVQTDPASADDDAPDATVS
ncbi:MAG: TerC family protein [Castellaniella sp.]